MYATTMSFEIINAELRLNEENFTIGSSAPLEVYILLKSSLDTGLRIIGLSYKLNSEDDIYEIRMIGRMAGAKQFLSEIRGKNIRAIVSENDNTHEILAFGSYSSDIFGLHNDRKSGLMTEESIFKKLQKLGYHSTKSADAD